MQMEFIRWFPLEDDVQFISIVLKWMPWLIPFHVTLGAFFSMILFGWEDCADLLELQQDPWPRPDG